MFRAIKSLAEVYIAKDAAYGDRNAKANPLFSGSYFQGNSRRFQLVAHYIGSFLRSFVRPIS